MERYDGETHINVGTGTDVTIRELATRVAHVVGFGGDFAFDATKPDVTPRKLLDVGLLRSLGWSDVTPLDAGLALAYADFRRRGATGVAAQAETGPSRSRQEHGRDAGKETSEQE